MAEDDGAEVDRSQPLAAELSRAWVDWLERLMLDNKWPLSGDVSQWINAWGEAVGQIGLFNFNAVGSSNPPLERRIGQQYSYGRQIGRMLEVLTPLVMANEAALQKEIGEKALSDFLSMVDDIRALKQSNVRSVDELVREVRSWRGKLTSQAFEQRRQALIRALDAPDFS